MRSINILGLLLIALLAQQACSTRYFPDSAVWYQDVTNAALDPQSQQTIDYLQSVGWSVGWGNADRFQMDRSFNILHWQNGDPVVPISRNAYYTLPDCSTNYTTFPLPPNGAIEGQTNYTCDTYDNDCHLVVLDLQNNLLWESYQSNVVDGVLTTSCVVVWELCREYPSNLRGDQCTSTDAAGFPIAPIIFTADEVASGVVDHALRITMENLSIRPGQYVHPASHCGGPSSQSDVAPIYGARLRLKQSFDASSYAPAAQVIITALKTYGMFLADGGGVFLEAASDQFTTATWDSLNIDTHALFGLEPQYFDVVLPLDNGERIPITYDCVLNTFPEPQVCNVGSGSGGGVGVGAGTSNAPPPPSSSSTCTKNTNKAACEAQTVCRWRTEERACTTKCHLLHSESTCKKQPDCVYNSHHKKCHT